MNVPYRNPIVHDSGPSNFPGPFELTDNALARYQIAREKFGTTEILLQDGSLVTVKDYQYRLPDGSIGMQFVPISDDGSVRDTSGQLVPGASLIDGFLRETMKLAPDEPIYALVNYFHPEQNKGTLSDLLTKTDKLELGFTHLGAYYGDGYTTNAPMLYHGHKFGVNGKVDGTPFGYPANVQVISLDGVPQGTLNKNLQYVDTCLNSGIMFPKDYKNSQFRPVDINTALMFYRDWIKFRRYLRNDDSWFTYCAAHKTLVATIALNLPHNLASFQEVYGKEEGTDLYQRFIKFYSNIIGPDPGFIPENETYFEPLWKKQGFTSDQIKPFTLAEYKAYDNARRAGLLTVFAGRKPLDLSEATCWTTQRSSDVIYDIIHFYADMLDVGPIVTSTIILGMMDKIDERMGIGKLEYLMHGMPIIEQLMLAHARMNAANDPKNYLQETFKALYLAWGGNATDEINFEQAMKSLHGLKGLGGALLSFLKSDPKPIAIAAWAMFDVAVQFEKIVAAGIIPPTDAYVQMMESIQGDLAKDRAVNVRKKDKIEYNTPPAITHLMSIGMYSPGQYVSVREVCTVVDFAEVQLKKASSTNVLTQIPMNQSNQEHPSFKNPDLTPAMKELLLELREIVANPVVEAAFNDAVAHVDPYLSDGSDNPWRDKNIDYFLDYFEDWFTFLPTPAGGLGKIVPFTYFYLNNRKAYYFLNTLQSRRSPDLPYSKEVFNWTVKFIKEHGKYMDSPASLKFIDQWMQDPSSEINDFIVPEGGFKSFNEFFTRKLKPSANARPIAFPDDDSLAVASADSEINFIESDLTLSKQLNVKSRQINVKDLLDGSDYARHFVGGTAVSCVLMPNNYHRYHSPVSGEIVESAEVPGIYNGIIDGEDWFNKWNVGESTTDFSIFEDFHRAYFVIDTKKYGYVAMIPVGLNTISAIMPSMVNNQSSMVPKGAQPVPVRKGDELGHFAYGGSLNILLFQPGVFSSISLLMGQRLGRMSPVTQ